MAIHEMGPFVSQAFGSSFFLFSESPPIFKRYFCFELPGFGCSGKYLFEVSGDITQCRCWLSSKGTCSALPEAGGLWGFNLMLPLLLASRNVALRQEGNKQISIIMPKVLPPKTLCLHEDISFLTQEERVSATASLWLC